MDEIYFFTYYEIIWGKMVRKRVFAAESLIRTISIYQTF